MGRGMSAFFFLVCGLSFAVATAGAADKRVALVIGVGAYRNAPALPNPPGDANHIAPILRRLGFETDLVVDPDRAALEAAVRRFGQRIDGAAAAVFFYAGHGMQVGGRNYLLPVDTKVERESDLRWEALDVQTVLESMEGPNRVSLVFLDACRDNPLSRSLASRMGGRSTAVGRGLAREEHAGAGTLIAYATDPGDVAMDGDGANSPFTTALAKYLVVPGLEVRQVMTRVRADELASTGGRQRPWDNSSLSEDFYFAPPPPSGPGPTATPPPPPSGPAPAAPARTEDGAAELAFWDSVRNSNDIRDVDSYLKAYPNGRFVELARNRRDRMQREALRVMPPPAVPPPAATAPAAIVHPPSRLTPSPAEPRPDGSAVSCQALWVERNTYYKQAGYCFATPRGIDHFGNVGCRHTEVSGVPLSREARARVEAIVSLERMHHCP